MHKLKRRSAAGCGVLQIQNKVFVFATREEKKKQKQEGHDTEEKAEISCSGSAGDQGSKGGGGSSQQPLKRGQKVKEERRDKMFCALGNRFIPLSEPKQISLITSYVININNRTDHSFRNNNQYSQISYSFKKLSFSFN